MANLKLNPAADIISALGGLDAVSRVAGVHRTRVWRWTQKAEVGGTGGLIPAKHQEKLLLHAIRNGLPVTAASFFPLTHLTGSSGVVPEKRPTRGRKLETA